MSMSQIPLSANALAADGRSLNQLKFQAGQNSPAAIKAVAKEFESLFMRELLKSMREATLKSGMLESQAGNLGTDLLDQQYAVQMSGQPGGLSDLIAQQLSRQMGVSDGRLPPPNPARNVGPLPSSTPAPVSKAAPTAVQGRFVREHQEAAARIERESGIPASYMLGQAGHETGWGQREIRMKDGSNSFNLFGIKAGPGWKGKTVDVTTTEYVDGEPVKRVAKFRAYGSFEESFRDYARLINENPRYAQARQQTGSAQAYASGLQRAGYATDPNYAAKLSRAINTTLQLQRAQA